MNLAPSDISANAARTVDSEANPPPALLVIGYGNTLRNDDGVGPRAVETLETLALQAVTTLSCALLTPELAEAVSRAHTVVFVDAAMDSPQEVRLRKLAPADSSQMTAHAASPATILALARDVFGHAPEAWVLTIPATDLGVGERLSPLAESGLALAVQWLEHFAKERSHASGAGTASSPSICLVTVVRGTGRPRP